MKKLLLSFRHNTRRLPLHVSLGNSFERKNVTSISLKSICNREYRRAYNRARHGYKGDAFLGILENVPYNYGTPFVGV